MKIIFDNEKQKQKFLEVLVDAKSKCPGYCDFEELKISESCTPATKDNCAICWERCGIEYEVKSDEAHPDVLIDIPADGSYVEILEHRIYGDWKKDGGDAFGNFCTYLKNVKDVYERNERLRKVLCEKATLCTLYDMVREGYLTPNDTRWISGEEELKDHSYDVHGTIVNNELMSKEDWMNKRIYDIRKAMGMKTRMLQILPIEWIYEYNELVAKLSVEEQ